MRKGYHNSLAAMGLAVGMAFGPVAQSDDTIRIAENDWTGQLIDINLAKIIMTEHMGLDVELVFADYTGQWAALATGDLDVAMEIWPAFSANAYEEWVVEKGKVEVIGDLGVVGTTGWYVPTYMIEGDPERGIEPMTPNLRSWEDINQYVDLLKRPETGDKAFCIDAVPSWEIHNEERLMNLGIDMVNVYAGTEGALIAEIESAYRKGEPLFICDFWTPHWIFAVYDLTEIELPPYSDECWGIGGIEPGDFACGFPEEPMYNVARVGFSEEHPEAYAFLKNMWLTTEQQQDMLFWVDVEGMSVDDAVLRWMAANEDIWRAWIPSG